MIAALLLSALLAPQDGQAPPTTIPEMWDAWCARCHGQDGRGKLDEPTITVEPMDFGDCRVATPEPDADWELAIAKGGPAVGLSSQMPAFGDTLSPDQVRGFVTHMRRFCAESGWPHGNMNFPRPIFTEKAFPENEFILLPMVTHRRQRVAGDVTPGALDVPVETSRDDFDLIAIYERRFGRRAMWEVAVPFSTRDTGEATRRGVSDIELAVKYVLGADASRVRIASAGLEVAVPTGSDVRGAGHGTVVFEPFLAAGTMVRDVYLQAHAKLELPADSAQAERAFVYNLYAGRDLSIAPSTWTLGVELNGENREVAVTPQIRKGLTKTGALGAAIGVRVPINERFAQGTRVVGYLLWEYMDPVRARP